MFLHLSVILFTRGFLSRKGFTVQEGVLCPGRVSLSRKRGLCPGGLCPGREGLCPGREGLCPEREGLCPGREVLCPGGGLCLGVSVTETPQEWWKSGMHSCISNYDCHHFILTVPLVFY